MRPRWIMTLEALSIAVFFGLVALLAVRMVRDASGWTQALLLLLAATAGYAMADVASGLTHWFCDTFFREDTRFIGRVLIFPFREHHRDPTAMTHHGFLELTGNSCMGVAPILGLAAWFPWSPYLDAALVAFALALFGTNLFHKWAHSATVPRWVGALQRCHLILNPARHSVHHTPPNKSAYCVTNGWMNMLLDRILP
jgi:plasmanylethanolamine desaturase